MPTTAKQYWTASNSAQCSLLPIWIRKKHSIIDQIHRETTIIKKNLWRKGILPVVFLSEYMKSIWQGGAGVSQECLLGPPFYILITADLPITEETFISTSFMTSWWSRQKSFRSWQWKRFNMALIKLAIGTWTGKLSSTNRCRFMLLIHCETNKATFSPIWMEVKYHELTLLFICTTG